jgi:hypothetical protein
LCVYYYRAEGDARVSRHGLAIVLGLDVGFRVIPPAPPTESVNDGEPVALSIGNAIVVQHDELSKPQVFQLLWSQTLKLDQLLDGNRALQLRDFCLEPSHRLYV